MTAGNVSQLVDQIRHRPSFDPTAEARSQRYRALANWEPGHPGENLDYYQEYIHRHVAINVSWLDLPKAPGSVKGDFNEATGIGTLCSTNSNAVEHVIAPLDDGSICIWDVSTRTTISAGGHGRVISKSKPGLLTSKPPDATSENHIMMTETGAVECVSIDNSAKRGFFAVQNLLHEVDLNTLQLLSTKTYPWPITALSEAKARTPITVGTNMTIHLHDPRDPAFSPRGEFGGGELIGGSVYSHATLAQPGPLSILHHDDFGVDDGSIWVAGRFTSLLNYDRRFFPRIRGTIHSRARIASLASMPYPLLPRHLDLVRNPEVSMSSFQAARNKRGMTILAAAEYKGKGSLELYGLPEVELYQNRQTASASKLLSVAPHGGRIVFSDGDGNLKWVERDGFTHVRTFNINDILLSPRDQSNNSISDASAYGLFSSTASEMPGQGDIVQKIIPTSPSSSHLASHSDRPDLSQDNLLLWTGDGRIGALGFGPGNPLGEDDWQDALEEQAKSTEERAREDAERQYGMAMRRALERNADEVRFVRGLGMGFMRN